MTIRCQKCRNLLFADNKLCDGHGKQITYYNRSESQNCTSSNNVFYIREETLPSWVKTQIDNYKWIKGKLYCQTCRHRIGAFDFVSGVKCECGSSVLPAVHVVSSKIDYQFAVSVATPEQKY